MEMELLRWHLPDLGFQLKSDRFGMEINFIINFPAKQLVKIRPFWYGNSTTTSKQAFKKSC